MQASFHPETSHSSLREGRPAPIAARCRSHSRGFPDGVELSFIGSVLVACPGSSVFDCGNLVVLFHAAALWLLRHSLSITVSAVIACSAFFFRWGPSSCWMKSAMAVACDASVRANSFHTSSETSVK